MTEATLVIREWSREEIAGKLLNVTEAAHQYENVLVVAVGDAMPNKRMKITDIVLFCLSLHPPPSKISYKKAPVSAICTALHPATGRNPHGSEDSYRVKVDNLLINPDPVVSGKPATFEISATSEDAISGGRLSVEVFFYGIHVHTESRDLCSKTTCPVKQGSFILTNSQSLPGFTPP
ncbi:hypothetical protein KI387_030564, partial [Taxus chinensis]